MMCMSMMTAMQEDGLWPYDVYINNVSNAGGWDSWITLKTMTTSK